MLVGALVLLAGALGVYAGLVWLANEYSRRTNWQIQHDGASYDWTLRRNTAIALGVVAVCAGAIFTTFWITDWLARCFVMGQAALMAAAGASDLRRFHLPLPFTLTGIGIALAGAYFSHMPTYMLLFALGWAALSILLHILASRGSIQLGDHIAMLWIALAAPYNGLLAVVMGDLANVVMARVKGLRGKKVAAAGAWLVCTAALIALPPYFAWFTPRFATTTLTPSLPQARAPLIQRVQIPLTTTQATTATLQMVDTENMLISLAETAGDHTASVALANDHEGRAIAARSAARDVAQIAPGNDITATLHELALALDTFDIGKVRDISAKLADQRQQLTVTISAQKIITDEYVFNAIDTIR
jgi:hypothetical protein